MKYLITIILSILTLVASALSKDRLKEILQSGDGTSFETAYKVCNLDEEYFTLEHKRQSPSLQVLMSFKNELYDVFTDKTTGKNIYFKLIEPSKKTKTENKERAYSL